jgi:hypothetical protein
MTEKKANHQANIVRIKEIYPHTNADTLEIIPIGEYQVVSKKGQFKVGDLGVYIQPDSVVPQTEPFRFIWEPYVDDYNNDPSRCKHKDTGPTRELPGEYLTECVDCHAIIHEDPKDMEPTVPEKKRRITVRKFRGEWSEGLLLPVSDFGIVDKGAYCDYLETYSWMEGSDISDFLGITHYDPDTGKEDGADEFAPKAKKTRYPKTLKGWLRFLLSKIRFFRKAQFLEETDSLGIPVYDVDALKNYPNTFVAGEQVSVTEKIHGSNARYLFLDGVMYIGSRNKWTAPGSSNPFRNALKKNSWIEEWCRAHEGYVLWGEVTPTQGNFDYGSKEPQFFVFDIRTPDGKWLDKTHENFNELVVPLIGHSVPVLYQGAYDIEKIRPLVDGDSKVPGAKHIREGVVIKTLVERHVHRLGRAQLKMVSNRFLEKDSK